MEIRALSSVGSEHLPYKQGVTGSNPVSPTKKSIYDFRRCFFFALSRRLFANVCKCIQSKNMATIKILLDKRRVCKGDTYPLILRVIHERKVKNYKLSIYLLATEWDEKSNLVKDKHPRSKEFNHKISIELGKAYTTTTELGHQAYTINDFNR